mmetsp:Transcript_116545/g.206088  ORF Transcript_116545/g.206088 Transcript_116545/m.206088 type:complete len:127 (+) Transcript_116545:134-514(+)
MSLRMMMMSLCVYVPDREIHKHELRAKKCFGPCSRIPLLVAPSICCTMQNKPAWISGQEAVPLAWHNTKAQETSIQQQDLVLVQPRKRAKVSVLLHLKGLLLAIRELQEIYLPFWTRKETAPHYRF